MTHGLVDLTAQCTSLQLGRSALAAARRLAAGASSTSESTDLSQATNAFLSLGYIHREDDGSQGKHCDVAHALLGLRTHRSPTAVCRTGARANVYH